MPACVSGHESERFLVSEQQRVEGKALWNKAKSNTVQEIHCGCAICFVIEKFY
jgi:hypothetical protein